MKTIILDGILLCEKETAHQYLQDHLEFPCYYGKNLDALYDCLTEIDEISFEICLPGKNTPYFDRILRVFQKASSLNPGISIIYK